MPKIGLWENALFAYIKMLPFIKELSIPLLYFVLASVIHTEHTLPQEHASSPWSCTSSPDYAQIRSKIKKK